MGYNVGQLYKIMLRKKNRADGKFVSVIFGSEVVIWWNKYYNPIMFESVTLYPNEKTK